MALQVEMRAVMACIPETFENDTSGEKSAWKASILDTIRSSLKQEESKTLPKNRIRNRLYFKGGPLKGPFDPEAADHSVAVTQSEAFAPTPQFIQVSWVLFVVVVVCLFVCCCSPLGWGDDLSS